MSEDPAFEREQAEQAAREAAGIGGDPGAAPGERSEPALRAVQEGGGGESEGFELAEQELIEHASHGDQQSAHAVLHHQGDPEQLDPDDADLHGAAGDHERSSEREEDEP